MPKTITLTTLACLLLSPWLLLAETPATQPAEESTVPATLNFTMKNIDGQDTPLAKYQGKVVLMVNVASRCGYTKQYTGLQQLHETYQDQGLVVLGFPANEFGGQEPGSDADIKQFCSSKYSVTFDMFSKIVVKGEGIHPLYEYLTSEKTNPQFPGPVGWNFEKFLIGKDGQIIGRFKSGVTPESDELQNAIKAALAK